MITAEKSSKKAAAGSQFRPSRDDEGHRRSDGQGMGGLAEGGPFSGGPRNRCPTASSHAATASETGGRLI